MSIRRVEDAWHVLTACTIFEQERTELRSHVEERGWNWLPEIAELVKTKEKFKVFARTSRRILQKKT